MSTRKCCVCKDDKVLDEFGTNNKNPLGKEYICKLCKKNKRKERAIKNGYWEEPNKRRKWWKEWHDKNRIAYNAKKLDWDKEHRQKNNKRHKEARLKLRDEVIRTYGGYKCNCSGGCNITENKFLCIDHIDGGGNKHRKEIGKSNDSLYRWLKKNNFPPGFQVLCHNCNLAKGFYGKCPHILEQI